MSRRVAFIMAGGTGGHVFPALATARVLRRRGFDIVWLGTQRGIEARLVPAEGIPVEWLSVGGLRGKGVVTLLAAPFRLVRAGPQSCWARAASPRARLASPRGSCGVRWWFTSRTRSRASPIGHSHGWRTGCSRVFLAASVHGSAPSASAIRCGPR